MMPKKGAKTGILRKRASEQGHGEAQKRSKPSPAQTRPQQSAPEEACALKLRSQLHRQCVPIVAKLLAAQATRRAGCTVKGLCLAPHVQNKKAVYAVVCETMRHQLVLQQILEASSFREAHPEGAFVCITHVHGAVQFSGACCLVMLYDLLLGQGIRPHSGPERTFRAHGERFRACASHLLRAHSAATLADLLPAQSRPPAHGRAQARHVRVNTLAATVQHVCTLLAQPPQSWPEHHREPIIAHQDEHLPDVLALTAPRGLHDHPLVECGALVLQSKASCMPAHALQPRAGWQVVDCCAAPGNKTTHVAALVGVQGRVSAFERDAKRCKTLQRTLERTRVTHVDVHNEDFLRADPQDVRWRDVRAVLLDPSCSGSGTAVVRNDFLADGGATQAAEEGSSAATPARTVAQATAARNVGGTQAAAESADFPGPVSCSSERVAKLASFQLSILKHALQFPALERIAYSTCSVNREENECVVAAALPCATELGFSLAHALPQWPRRGLVGYEWADRVARVHPDLDGTDGFFVALFERTGGTGDNACSVERAREGSR